MVDYIVIDGYWKNDNEPFHEYKISLGHDPEISESGIFSSEDFDDDEIFFYLGNDTLEDFIADISQDWVITKAVNSSGELLYVK